MRRRDFLAAAGGAAGAMALTGCGARTEDAAAAGRTLDRLGVQLYTVRDRMAESVPRTLGQVAEIGYDEVEFAGYYDHPPSEIREFLDDTGLTAPATHIPIDRVRQSPDALIETAQVIGHEYLVVPWIGEGDRGSVSAYQQVAEDFNRFAEQCRAAGLRFGYHNHDFEFERVGERLGYDILLDETDPDLVTMEIDLFWVRRGGQEPLAYFRRHPGRFALCHVKDMDASGGMVDVGDGIIGFAEIFAHSVEAGMRHYFVEHDSPGDSLQSIERSFAHLSTLTF